MAYERNKPGEKLDFAGMEAILAWYRKFMQYKITDIIGKRFGRLEVIARCDSVNRCAVWACRCDCGKEAKVFGYCLRRGTTTSCGCFSKEITSSRTKTHGMKGTTEYRIWAGIKRRCLNPNVKEYPRYGGRGITMCDEWKNSFQAFYRDMGPRPDGRTIDRIDNDGHYCLENCRWASDDEQQNNRRSNRLIYAGGMTKNLTQWSNFLGKKTTTLHAFLKRGESIESLLPGRA